MYMTLYTQTMILYILIYYSTSKQAHQNPITRRKSYGIMSARQDATLSNCGADS
jgi:hypothetical protein